MQVIVVLGNQLFPPSVLRKAVGPGACSVFMREDFELCTHFKYHQQKILFFLVAMRKCAQELQQAGFDVHYEKLGENSGTYDQSLSLYLKKMKPAKVGFFEVEDQFFADRLASLLSSLGIAADEWPSPMFLTARQDFKDYLKGTRKPFMKTFYERQRKKLGILVDSKGQPEGGQWSFDEDNRKPLPKNFQSSALPSVSGGKIENEVLKIIAKHFSSHPGRAEDFWLPTDRAGAQAWLQAFLQDRLMDFGPYEDALSAAHPFVAHSVLTPLLNVGLLTPAEVISETLKFAKKKKIALNSLEGFVRQVIGWREFIRGIYQNFHQVQETRNFWGHHKKLTDDWWRGTTGIAPLDDVIMKTQKYGYAHHIERLMIVGNLMLLLEVDPLEAHRWFMEMFIDSSDWVMGPNVFGMALFSDGGIFATKPYICGSNYYRKMGGYKTGDWQDGVDGLYWTFIGRHREHFQRNPRMAMMVKTFDKMPDEKKRRLTTAANLLRARLTR